jgi:hypothetical protein
VPSLPWYGKLKTIVAPTDRASTVTLVVVLVVVLLVLWKGDPVHKAAVAVYLVSP